MDQKRIDRLDAIRLPLLPLRDVIVYPHMVAPLFVGREGSIQAIRTAKQQEQQIFLVAQKDALNDCPDVADLYTIGTVANILQLLQLQDGTIKVLVEGAQRGVIRAVESDGPCRQVVVNLFAEQMISGEHAEAISRSLYSQFEHYAKFSKKISSEVVCSLADITDPGCMADSISALMPLSIGDKQKLLEIPLLTDRLEYLLDLIATETDLLQVEKRLRGRVKKQMESSQREYYLHEQMKAIQKELGTVADEQNETEQLKAQIEEAMMPAAAEKKALAELGKLRQMATASSEAAVVRGYLEWLISLPWKKRSKIRYDLKRACQILDEDHYGLASVKERIIEYIAVQKRVKKLRGPVLCLVGPPGVGKTSLGESLARATGRKFVRIALGGLRDEAEVRGHRRTYVGSMPGKLIQKIAKAAVKNPLVLLDEVDKMGTDMRGDPASALLEVLDPEQNSHFNDHYLEVDYDLSDVMFVCTSNSMNLPPPLLDRMEVIRIPGYTEDEKINIATHYLIPKQKKMNGIRKGELCIEHESIQNLIRYYTREAGVRGLEREIAQICRRVVKEKALHKEDVAAAIDTTLLERYSGVRKFDYGVAEEQDQVGRVTGLAWTEVGGELLTVEAVAIPGKGTVNKTGSLGDVMQESIHTAITVVASRAKALGIAEDFQKIYDLHIHVPEGATPKDGPSAGVAMCTALISVLTDTPVKAAVAMTGEITLRGQVLSIGGLKEKLLAAHRGGIGTVLIPESNVRELKEIPDNIKQDLDICPVKWIDQVLEVALQAGAKR